MSEPRSWARRWISEPEFAELAVTRSASELWSLLLEVMDRRATARSPAEVLRQWSRDPFTRPSEVDQRSLVELDAHLLAAAEGFESLELSPVTPLGTCSTVGLASQNKILSALRGTEVVSDPTNVLALESARRLRTGSGSEVRLVTSHRCVRAQAFPGKSGYAQHFRMFCLATGGRERADHGFLVGAITEHIEVLLRAMQDLQKLGYTFPGRRLTLLTTPEREVLGDRIEALLGDIKVERQRLEHPYYDGVRYMLWARSAEGDEIPLGDGGAFDWLAKLAADRKLAFISSGFGTQLAAKVFRR